MKYTLQIIPEKLPEFLKKIQELERLGIIEKPISKSKNRKARVEQFISKWAGAFRSPQSEQGTDPRFDYLMEKYK